MSVSLDLKSTQLVEPPRRRRVPVRATELGIALIIFGTGTWVGTRAVQTFRAVGGAQYFYQSDFGPAVMLACGRGLQDPDPGNAPALAAFLLQQTDGLDCEDLPPGMPAAALNDFQRSSRYLEAAVALTWKAVGVSWARLALLNGALFGAVAALTYGLLRLAMSRALALLALVPSVTSTTNLMQVPQLRDYARGPFLLAIILIMGIAVLHRMHPRRVISWSVAAGAVLGLGTGFRTDVMIALLPFAITLAILVPPTVPVRVRVAAIAAFLAAFVVVAFPALRRLSQGGNNGHVTLLGLVSEFDGPLRIEPSVYRFGGRYVDSLAFVTIDSYAGCRRHIQAVRTRRERVSRPGRRHVSGRCHHAHHGCHPHRSEVLSRFHPVSAGAGAIRIDPCGISTPRQSLVAPGNVWICRACRRHRRRQRGQPPCRVAHRARDDYLCRRVRDPVSRAALLLSAVRALVDVRPPRPDRDRRAAAVRDCYWAPRRTSADFSGARGRHRRRRDRAVPDVSAADGAEALRAL